MDYRFNYRFLKDWMEVNDFNARDLLNSLGTQNHRSANAWINGERIMPVSILLRICNTFQIPLESFFFQLDDTPAQIIRHPKEGDQSEPKGGYTADNERKGSSAINPKANYNKPTIMPKAYPNLPVKGQTPTANAQQPMPLPAPAEYKQPSTQVDDTANKEGRLLTDSIEVLRLKVEHQQELMKAQDESRKREDDIRSEFLHRSEKLREKLYSIIESQQKTINIMQQQLSTMQSQSQSYRRFSLDEGTMAAESLEHKE